MGFSLSGIKRFLINGTQATRDGITTGRRAATEVVANQGRAVARVLGSDRFEDRLATGKIADPVPMRDELGAVIANRPAHGRLFVGGISEKDVSQGAIGDCYFLASLAAVAGTHPELIQNAIKKNDDGTVTVTFHQGGELVPITVDADLPRVRWPVLDGAQVYGGGGASGELWPALVEKAYAQWKGSYDAIGNGGWPGSALEAITGKGPDSLALRGLDPAAVAARIGELAKAKTPITATTPEHSPITGIVSGHVYSVDGVVQHDGQWYVKLRNPWGMGEPVGFGKNDGAFLLPAKDFVRGFDDINWVQ
jgi:hypothetical protein